MLSISDRLNVLDLGSGTGGISLGLLDLFRQPQLDHIKCDIYAIDSSKISLSKQNQLINNYGLNGSTHKSDIADLTVPATYQKSLSEKSPFDFIFCANVLSEMNLAYVKNVLELIHDNLDEDGICIIAESQNTPAKTACAYLSRHVKEYGLHVFYPCIPNVECKQSECWKWFNHYFDCDDVLIGDDCFEIMKIHKVIWRILVKKPLSIYDYLNKRKNGLNWGVVRHNNGAEWDEFCTQKGQRNGIISPKLPSKVDQSPWSHIIGISADDQKVLSEWNPVDDFSNRNCKIEAIED
jgi:SAM-dependent methyltransferase